MSRSHTFGRQLGKDTGSLHFRDRLRRSICYFQGKDPGSPNYAETSPKLEKVGISYAIVGRHGVNAHRYRRTTGTWIF